MAASAFTGASDEPTFSGLAAPADSCDPTVEGPAPKRLRAGHGVSGSGWGLGGVSSAWGASAATCDSDDSDGEEAVVSRKRPTPQKAAAAAVARPAARLAALHPPPTWAQGGGAPSTQQPRHVHWGPAVQVGAGGRWSRLLRDAGRPASAPSPAPTSLPCPPFPPPRPQVPAPPVMMEAEAAQAAAEEGEGSDMEAEDEWCRPWERFPLPHPLDVEE